MSDKLPDPYVIAAIEGSVMNRAGCDTPDQRAKFLAQESEAAGYCFFQAVQKGAHDIEGRKIRIVITLDD